MNGIKAIIAFGEMLLLTAGGEFKVSGGGKAITGSNVLSQPQEYRVCQMLILSLSVAGLFMCSTRAISYVTLLTAMMLINIPVMI